MKKSIALSLSGGGARGFAHLGVIFELERQGYVISSISGSSMGALIAAVVAARKVLPFTNFILSLQENEINNFLEVTFDSKGVIKVDKLFTTFAKGLLPDLNIEDLSIPLTIIATDLDNHSEKIFTTGSLHKAIRSSIAIPSVITPQKTDEETLVDGCVINPLPLNRTKRMENDLLVGVNLFGKNSCKHPFTTHEENFKENPLSYLFSLKKHFVNAIFDDKQFLRPISIIRKSVNLMTQQLIYNSIEINKPDLMIHIPMNCCTEFDFDKGKELIKLGISQTQEALKKL